MDRWVAAKHISTGKHGQSDYQHSGIKTASPKFIHTMRNFVFAMVLGVCLQDRSRKDHSV